jgi:hypothetical protein
MRRLLAVVALALLAGVLGSIASGACPGWPAYQPWPSWQSADVLLTEIEAQANSSLDALPVNDPRRDQWHQVIGAVVWARLDAECGRPGFNTCDRYYAHVFAAHILAHRDDPVGCFDQLDHDD